MLWFIDGSPDLPDRVRDIIESPDNDIEVSIASFWEIGIKAGIGKLELSGSLFELAEIADQQSIEIVPITIAAISICQKLVRHHKDPFDRIIASAAIVADRTVLSADKVFDLYEVRRIWQ